MNAPDPLVHAPARLEIMVLLNAAQEADFVFLQRETGLTKGNLAAHLNKLETAAYLSVEKTFRGRVPRTRYRLTGAGRAALRGYCQHLRVMLERLS